MLSGDNGILQKATDAKTTSERAEAKEQAKMDIMAYIADKTAKHQDASLDDTKIQEILSDNKSYVKTANTTSFITTKGEYEIPYSELYVASATTLTPTLPAGTYTLGEEIEFAEESFFVIKDNGDSVLLLAKYDLNKQGTLQENAKKSITGRKFSNTDYWASISGITYPYNLQSEEMIAKAKLDGEVDAGVKSAVITAKDYGILKGVTTGRLMTYAEANSIKNGSNQTLKNILWGLWTEEGAPVDHYLNFWLGDAVETGDSDYPTCPGAVWGGLYPGKGEVSNGYYFEETRCGVRPVLTIQKAQS